MRHFAHLTPDETSATFAVPPQPFDRDSSRAVLAVALGATLYSPGTRPGLSSDAHRAASIGATSQVWCLEDSIAHCEVADAQANVIRNLRELAACTDPLPLLFIRVRTPQQVVEIATALGSDAAALSGFVLPKIVPDESGEEFLRSVAQASQAVGRHLWAMPVLEHRDLAWRETRGEHLDRLRRLFDAEADHILSLRIGGTDLCGLFGLRRDPDTAIWDVAVVRDVLADVLNTFTRLADWTCSGPVWEHFNGNDRLLRPQLRQTPFADGGHLPLRQRLLSDHADALLREVLLDRQNGLTGKTVIHPTHVAIVNTMHTVSRDEYDDAVAILADPDRGGIAPSAAGNKMNEIGPHSLWAEQVMLRASVFGVLARPAAVIDLLQLGRAAADRAFTRSDTPVLLT